MTVRLLPTSAASKLRATRQGRRRINWAPYLSGSTSLHPLRSGLWSDGRGVRRGSPSILPLIPRPQGELWGILPEHPAAPSVTLLQPSSLDHLWAIWP